MAEVLIKLVDATHPDPEIDRAGCYKAGMPVVVMPDGHSWGRKECPPTFFRVKLLGVSVEEVQGYLAPVFRDRDYAAPTSPDVTPVSNQIGPIQDDDPPQITRACEWQFRMGNMSPADAQTVTTGEISVGVGGDVSWDAMKQNLYSHRLGFTERRSAPRA